MSATQQERKTFHLCLDIAMECLDLIESGGKPLGPFFAIDSTAFINAIKLHRPDEITDEQIELTGQLLAEALTQHGLSTCAMWTIAHTLEHIFYAPEKIQT